MKGSVSPDQGWSPCPLQWKHRALPSGLPEKSPDQFFFLFLVHLKKKKKSLDEPRIRKRTDLLKVTMHWAVGHTEGDMSDTASPGLGPASMRHLHK